ncbi:MAG: CRISPR-associated helicase Cas3' [Terrisporobacter sp.]
MDADNRLEILNQSVLEDIEIKLAKPNKTIKEHTIELLNVLDVILELGYIQDDKIYKLVEKACIYHDLGKLNEEFQKRVKSNKLKFNKDKEVAHNVLSLYFINNKDFDSIDDYLKVAHSVLNHHDYCNTLETVIEKEELINKLIEKFETYKVKRSTKNKLASIIEDNESIKIKGYLHKCDYNASSGNTAEYPNDFLNQSLEELMKRWKIENKDSNWNELQKFCIENKNENIIAVAQTGMGKTEAGLLWIGDTKGFFVLPLRTAINAIYDRVRKELLNGEKIDNRLAILHSSSLEYYINTLNKEADEKEKIDLINYQNIGRQFSIPLNISTMDQLFDFVYKYQGYELKLTTLSYSKIVIDEIQMYGPDLLAYLICGLEKIVELGGKIAILTATLPPFVKDLLEKNISFKYNPAGFTNDMKRHNLKVLDKRINASDIYEKYMQNKDLDKENKVLVVCNTIKEAQRIYEELTNMIEDGYDEIKILHSKFIRKERLEKESEIIEFGKTYDKDKNIDKQNGIWISTSIVEASLDIDFDYLFTELQDLNSLFQRLGRCNRKGKKDSSNYNCYIYTDIDKANLINGDKGFIDKKLFELSKVAISSHDGQISEKEKIKLIDTYLTTENLKHSDYMREYRKVYDFIKDIQPYKFKPEEIDLRNILSQEIIPSPIYNNYLEDIKDLELRLKDKNISKEERIKLKDDIKKYTMSVHPNDVRSYERAVRNRKATTYNKVRLSEYENIRVVECIYDEAGYKRMKYDEEKIDTNMFIF